MTYQDNQLFQVKQEDFASVHQPIRALKELPQSFHGEQVLLASPLNDSCHLYV